MVSEFTRHMKQEETQESKSSLLSEVSGAAGGDFDAMFDLRPHYRTRVIILGAVYKNLIGDTVTVFNQ